MVRINLLPVRVSKKKEAGKQQLVIFAVLLLAGLAGNYLWQASRAADLKARQAKLARTKEDIAQLERIIGEVRNAGQFAFQPGMTVETAVAVAGGFTPRANQHGFKITRKAGGATEEIEVMALDQVQPGDTVRVGERFF